MIKYAHLEYEVTLTPVNSGSELRFTLRVAHSVSLCVLKKGK